MGITMVPQTAVAMAADTVASTASERAHERGSMKAAVSALDWVNEWAPSKVRTKVSCSDRLLGCSSGLEMEAPSALTSVDEWVLMWEVE